jgi:hypothetical protein
MNNPVLLLLLLDDDRLVALLLVVMMDPLANCWARGLDPTKAYPADDCTAAKPTRTVNTFLHMMIMGIEMLWYAMVYRLGYGLACGCGFLSFNDVECGVSGFYSHFALCATTTRAR